MPVAEQDGGAFGRPDVGTKCLEPVPPACLASGSTFQGCQRSSRATYAVSVSIQSVDLPGASLCGYLDIAGLTQEPAVITTLFEAEIIGPKYSFLTGKWDATEQTDREHWSKFTEWHPYAATFATDHQLLPADSSPFLFMRWKEQFLVPDHRVRSIAGASFAGFYYVCLTKATGAIQGLYFHSKSEWFQSLSLRHVPPRGTGAFAFH